MLGDHEQFAIAEIPDARREAVAEEVEQGENALDRARRVGRVLLDLQRTIVMQEAIKDVGRLACRGRGRLRQDNSRQGALPPRLCGLAGPFGWRLVVAGIAADKAIGASSIQPLVRLGLLEGDPAEPHRLTVSGRGRSTWERFLDSGGRYPEDLTRL